MGSYSKLVDGQKALRDQENDLNGLEQFGFSKVTKYVKQTGGAAGTKLNEASLDDAPMSGEPTFDDSVLYLATAAREAYPEEIARRQEREAWRAYRMLPWWRKIWTKAPHRRAA